MIIFIVIIKVLLGLQKPNKGGAGEELDLNIGYWEDFGLPDKDVDYDVADDVDVDEDEDEDEVEDEIEKEEWDENNDRSSWTCLARLVVLKPSRFFTCNEYLRTRLKTSRKLVSLSNEIVIVMTICNVIVLSPDLAQDWLFVN